MTETPEEVALRRALMALRLEVDGSIVDDFTKYADAALRAQYVAGLEKALGEVDADTLAHLRIRELAEQAKREGTTP